MDFNVLPTFQRELLSDAHIKKCDSQKLRLQEPRQ